MSLSPFSPLGKMMHMPARNGVVKWIGVRPAHRADLHILDKVQAENGKGLLGDRYQKLNGDRQVTLIEQESLYAIASHLGLEYVLRQNLRRNIVTQGTNLLALKGRRFKIGEAMFEASGECHSCSRMEKILGAGGYNAVRGLGGITARVIIGGAIKIGDSIESVDIPATPESR